MTTERAPRFEPETLAEYPEVQRWLSGAGYEARPPGDREEVLNSLSGFCNFMSQTPSELVASCLRMTPEGTAISTKGRRAITEAIERYVSGRGLSGRSAIVVGNHVRGFLVHNGVFIQGPVSTS